MRDNLGKMHFYNVYSVCFYKLKVLVCVLFKMHLTCIGKLHLSYFPQVNYGPLTIISAA